MNLDPESTERLIGMVSSKDKEDRILAYRILYEYFTHIMFSFKRNIGYLLLIHKNVTSWDDDDDEMKIKFLSIIQSNAPSKSGFYSYSDIITITDFAVKQSDKEQRRMVYEYACKSMRQTLKIDE